MPTDAPDHTEARWHRWRDAGGSEHVELSGNWTLSNLAPLAAQIDRDLSSYARNRESIWDLRGIARLDDVAASLILRAWNWRRPARLNMKPEHAVRIAALEHTPARSLRPQSRPLDLLIRLGQAAFSLFAHTIALITLVGRLLLDVLLLARHPAQIPWREISANIHRTGGEALLVTALVGFLIGVVLSYLSALQLRQYGADLYIINVVGIGITRELGPLLAAILVAGRSGSSMTAQLGVMRVTQELDALSVMGISHTMRLVLPKVIALSITLPLLITWTDAVGLVGGALVAQDQLGIAFGQFMRGLPDAVPVANLWLGWGKAVLFGALIAVVACHYGLRIKPNTESLGINTTASVVTAITLVIVIDAGVAVLFRDVGFY